MPPIIRYFQAVEYTREKKEKDIYYVQTEWIQNRVLVGDDPNEEFCRITITDLVDYWQRTITSELIENFFPDSRFLVIRARNRALTDALNGARHERAAPVSWEAAKEPDSDKLRFYLKTYLGKIALNAGNFLVDKVDESEYMNIRRTWHKNTTIASHAFLEAGVSQDKELEDVNKNLDQMKEFVDTMNRESFEYKLSMFSNFTKVLGAKKEKILELEREVIDERSKRKYEEIEVKEETKELSISQTPSQKVTKKRKTTKSQSSQKVTKSQQASQSRASTSQASQIQASQSQSSQIQASQIQASQIQASQIQASQIQASQSQSSQSQQASQSQKVTPKARASPNCSADLTPPNSSTELSPPDSSTDLPSDTLIDLTDDIEEDEDEEEDHSIESSLPKTLPTFDDYDGEYVDPDYDSTDDVYINCFDLD